MLRFEELIQFIALIFTLVVVLYKVIKITFDCYEQDLKKEKKYSISKTQKDIEKRLNKMNRRKRK